MELNIDNTINVRTYELAKQELLGGDSEKVAPLIQELSTDVKTILGGKTDFFHETTQEDLKNILELGNELINSQEQPYADYNLSRMGTYLKRILHYTPQIIRGVEQGGKN